MTKPQSAPKQVVEVSGLPKPRGVWSVAVTATPGRLVFVSGLLSKDSDGEVVGIGDMAAQMEQVLKNLELAMQSAGGTLDDIVRVDLYTRDISKFAEIHAVRARYFKKDPPASTMVEVSALTDPRCLIELTAIAVLP
ncbi:RidA family protein [Lacisediminimonas sp.]|uniref:RidA family protein n=1 Tax=Lacisediminimonas sp. TaxID=3060582 RepID=UPI00271D1647|nr:RidA family protein [Lacisediminimonas sp.]MDO8300175.1 RidA family protein [Lacisediminimonas sp.]